MPKLTFKERVIAGVIASILVIVVFGPCGIMDDPERVEVKCAREVGVEWTEEEGATEELEAFSDCVVHGRLQ